MVDTVAANNLPKPTMTDQGTTHVPTMKQPTSMLIFPHQHAEKSLHNQHVLSILQVDSNHLQHRLSRTSKPKSRHKTNTFCPSSKLAATNFNTDFSDYRSRTWCLSSVFRLGLRAKVAVI